MGAKDPGTEERDARVGISLVNLYGCRLAALGFSLQPSLVHKCARVLSNDGWGKKNSGGPSPPEYAVPMCYHAAIFCATLSVWGLRPAMKSSNASAARAARAASIKPNPANVV
jgi:hypothetical protein